MKRNLPFVLLILAFIGMLDAGYLTFEHYTNSIPPCYNSVFSDCGKVLTSNYSSMFGIPVALFGVFHYVSFVITLVYTVIGKRQNARAIAMVMSLVGFAFSLYFVFLQLVIIKSICLYCMLSALISISIFILFFSLYARERKILMLSLARIIYKTIIKKILFTQDPEKIHNFVVRFSEFMGRFWIVRTLSKIFFSYENTSLIQKIEGIRFSNPVGLAAGFDYEAQLTHILPAAGFGFQSIGTITNHAYKGNPKPMLGRLPKSKSLMVNKGFKNNGAAFTVKKLKHLHASYPVGISIGPTNNKMTVKQTIDDICTAFQVFEKSRVKNAYYELNISCPNLIGSVSFYEIKSLDLLLNRIDTLKLSHPLFVKMPIDQSDILTLQILKTIAKHSPIGVIIGNLQSNKKDPAFVQEEVQQFSVGKFSGKPTFQRSNDLISLTYKHFKQRFIIIGCGGVFSAEDAYEKIKRGASLIQLITGMIFEGPTLISEINYHLAAYLKRDGFEKITDAVGTKELK